MNTRSAVLGSTALVVLLTAGAAQSLAGSNTVTTDDIVDGTIKHVDIKPNTIGSSRLLNNSIVGTKIADNSVKGADIDESTLDPQPAAKAIGATPQSFTNTEFKAVQLSTEDFDNANMFDPATPSRLTIQRAGIYHVTGEVTWAANATGSRRLFLKINGANRSGVTALPLSGQQTRQVVTGIFKLAAGSSIQIFADQASGGTLDIVDGAGQPPSLSAVWLSN